LIACFIVNRLFLQIAERTLLAILEDVHELTPLSLGHFFLLLVSQLEGFFSTVKN
jgi:hypothetical protein